MSTTFLQYWPVISTALAGMFGGLVSWTAVKMQISSHAEKWAELERRVTSVESAMVRNQIESADRLARLETTLAAQNMALARIEATLIRLESK